MQYVYSTATCSTVYAQYEPPISGKDNDGSSDGFNKIVKKVTIQGGNGVATKHLFTPFGVMTPVSDDEMEFLLKDKNFQRHVKNGFISYDKKKVDPEKKAKNMKDKDGSFPLTPKDFEKGQNDSDDLRIYKGTAGVSNGINF
jgi:hypothetical protein